MAPTRLLLVRHPETDWDDQRRWHGQSDPPLNAWGRERLPQVLELARSQEVTAIYTSDLERAHETAAWIGAVLRLTPVVTDRLRERGMGEWEGRTAAEMEAECPDQVAAMQADPFGFAPPGGESLAEVLERAAPVLRKIAERHPGAAVLVVTHGGVMRALLQGHLAPERAAVDAACGNGDHVLLEAEGGGWRILKPQGMPARSEEHGSG